MDWHALSEKEVIKKLGSDEIVGLTNAEASKRLTTYGANKLLKVRTFNALKVLVDQFKSFLILILIFAAILSFFMESKIDSFVILAIIILNAGLGFLQEFKAERAIEELKKLMVPLAKVVRNGVVVEINSELIVPGDILILSEGDKIVADARILSSNNLNVNEASFTGESVAELKTTDKIAVSLPLADRTNMAYQGTDIVSGSARAIVIGTGMNTELGKLSGLVQSVSPETNPFKEKLDSFAKRIGIFILILSALIVGVMISKGVGIFESFLVAVSLAVSAIPEGLPAVISLGLALATRYMLKKNILIRKLPASETLGRTTIICTDKTGTLTESKMKVAKIYTNGQLDSKKNTDLLFKIGILCNKARLEIDEHKQEYFIGDPTEIALIASARGKSLDKKRLTELEPKIKEFPFSSERKIMSIVRNSSGKNISYVKGAPEKIVSSCDYELVNGKTIKLSEKSRKNLVKVYEDISKEGLRVLGFAYKEIKSNKFSQETAETGLVFVGFQGMIDPPRPEVRGAIKSCNEAGIKVLMITGDSKLTAESVARTIGLNGRSVDSIELQKMSDKELAESINSISVFSRINPEDKLRIINILKQNKEIVAMTGDGVNDALALKRADIGIAMGIRGTDVAKDSSDIVLVDDNFASIVEGVKEGRRIYDNIKKFVKLLLSANFYEVALVAIMIVFGYPLPLLPLQILWINLVTDSLPALALSSEPMEKDVMKRKPGKENILHGIKGFILLAGIVGFALTSFFFLNYLDDVNKARTMVVTGSIIFQMLLAFNCKSKGPIFKSPINKYLIYAVAVSVGLHLIVLYTSLNHLFDFVVLDIIDWAWIIGAGLIGFSIMEVYKIFENKQKQE